jgi:outer membrane receptor protein involved in Fe transport
MTLSGGNMFKHIGRIVAIAAFAASLTSELSAQGGSSTINGTVFDQGKAVLPGVTVVATNQATGLTRETVTGPEGQFVLPAMPPGTYTVRAELQGFQAREQQVVLRIGQELTVDLALPLAGVAETVTVTSEAPLIETTTNRIGTNITDQEIDTLPSQGRNYLSLMQVVPGLVPDLEPGEFEGGNFSANGRGTQSNLFMVDGASGNDTDGGGTGFVARVTLDTISEFQVLTHQYTAEYGGSSGVIVNAVTKGGTNDFAGRGFYYFEDDSLRSRDPFLDPDEEMPESGRDTFGFNVGGPIVRNKAFFFFNYERNLVEHAVTHVFPAEAQSIAQNYADATLIKATSLFGRVDYNVNSAHNINFRYVHERAPAIGEDYECCVTLDNRVVELDSNDNMYNGGWTWVIGNRATNEFRASTGGQFRFNGNLAYSGVAPEDYFSSGWIEGMDRVGLNGRDQFDIGSANGYEDFTTGLAADHSGADSRLHQISDTFTFITPNAAHTFKAGFGFSDVADVPLRIGSGDNGEFSFQHNTPFRAGNPFTYPSVFSIVLGDITIDSYDKWYNGFVQDQWRLNPNLTLNAGLRLDRQEITPATDLAVSPRVGFAYDPTGEGRTVIRGGIGRFYEYHLLPVRGNLTRRGVFSQTFTYETDEDQSFERGAFPSDVCLNPVQSGNLAAISPACRAFLTNLRASLQPGAGAEFINTEPWLDNADRRMGYLWSYSAGVQHELMPNLAVGVDFVGHQGRDQTGQIDISEGPVGANGRVTRLTPAQFDPQGVLIPASARGARFQRVLQYQTLNAFNSDFTSLEMSMDKRFSQRWSGRVAYTLAYSNNVVAQGASLNGRVTDEQNPRRDYGRSSTDNRHAFVTSVNTNPFGGLNLGAIFRYYSGYPINETIGSDVNADRDNNDRPVRGVHDAGVPIVSEVDSQGQAVRNGIDGESTRVLDLQVQYVFNLPATQTLGLFWETYNALNTINYGNPTGNRRSARFLVPDEAGPMRSMQLGVRYTF